jgi:hypothetical protein
MDIVHLLSESNVLEYIDAEKDKYQTPKRQIDKPLIIVLLDLSKKVSDVEFCFDDFLLKKRPKRDFVYKFYCFRSN